MSTYRPPIANRAKQLRQERGFVLFDVIFEDGGRASNQRMPMEIPDGLVGHHSARVVIEQQETELAQKADRLRMIQSLT